MTASKVKEYIDIAVCFDGNVAKQACVMLKSLFKSKLKSSYHYRVHCIVKQSAKDVSEGYLRNLVEYFDNESLIYFYNVDENELNNAFEIRDITTATYFRFLIPELLVGISKLIYLDIDIIINEELDALWNIDMDNLYFRGVKSIMNLTSVWNKHRIEFDYWKSMDDIKGNYINAGVMVINLNEIRQSNIVSIWKGMAEKKYNYQDQDIINITSKGKIGFIPFKYNYFAYLQTDMLKELEYEKIYTEKELREGYTKPVIIHYAGNKPWKLFMMDWVEKWWNYVIDDDILFKWFQNDLINCIQNSKQEYEERVWQAKRNNKNYLFVNQWFALKQKGFKIAEVLERKKYFKIAIYGYSHIGQRLYDELQDSNIEVVYAIDNKKNVADKPIRVYELSDSLPNADVIIVTAIFFYINILSDLRERTKIPVISIESLLTDCF